MGQSQRDGPVPDWRNSCTEQAVCCQMTCWPAVGRHFGREGEESLLYDPSSSSALGAWTDCDGKKMKRCGINEKGWKTKN